MNENAKKWVEALRSGEYEQGVSYLHINRDDGEDFCCLGVACELYQKENGSPLMQETLHSKIVTYNSCRSILPYVVKDWLGLRTNSGVFYTTDEDYEELTVLNDKGVAFDEISNIIESEPTGLFKEN